MTKFVYQIKISRLLSADFLEDAQGALLQAQVESVAREYRDDSAAPVAVVARKEGDEVSLILSAPDPDRLNDLADEVRLRFGHELPDVEELISDRPGVFATQTGYSAHHLYSVIGAMLVEATALALVHEALEREGLNDQDGLAAAWRADAAAYRYLSERIGVSPPTSDSVDLQAARALLDAVPQEPFLGVEISGDGGHAVLALLKERDLITEHEAITAALALR